MSFFHSISIVLFLFSFHPCFCQEETLFHLTRILNAYDLRNNDSAEACYGRLTLTSGTAVTTSDVTGATTVYFTPFNGNKISLYTGTVWNLISFSEASVAVPNNTVRPFDIFGYSNSGTLTLEATAWTNDTTRATALTLQDGVYVKSGDATRRYLGTGRTTSVSGQTEDSASRRLLWSQCNRIPRKLLAQSSTDTWNYSTGTLRAANNSTSIGVTRVEVVLGLVAEPIHLEVYVPTVTWSTGWAAGSVSIGIDATNSTSGDYFGGWAQDSSNGGGQMIGGYIGIPAAGYHYLQWLEYTFTFTGTVSWYTSSAGNYRQGGMTGISWQ